LLQSNDTLATEIAKVRGGLILWEIIDRFVAKQTCIEKCAGQPACTCWPSKLKYYLYSSHYGVLMGLIASLGFDKIDVDRDVLPPDSSTFFFELWRRPAGEFYVKPKISQRARLPARRARQ
ncbi:esophageal gland cell secretory protein 21, partial [Aphelenchoides avenae]